MIGFVAIFAAAVSGYAGVGVWTVVLTAIALLSLSQARYGMLHQRAGAVGLGHAAKPFFLISVLNALAATSFAYGFGVTMQFV